MPSAISVTDLLTIPGIILLVGIIIQVAKVYLPADYIQLFALGLAIVLGLVAVAVLGPWTAQGYLDGFLRGVVAGAASVGGYQIAKPFGLLKSRSEQLATKK
jgi:membrane protein implicated in regulation of membrane protease activity